MSEPQPGHDDIGARINRFLDTRPHGRSAPAVLPLTGDASDRRYFRVLRTGEPSEVLAVYPGAITFATLPFGNVSRLLAAMPVPTPRVLSHSDALGIIALEDLGDLTLQAHLATAPADDRARLYRQAVGLIHTLQRRGRELASPEFVPYSLAFDVDKLVWELRFFATHFLEGHRGATIGEEERRALDAEFSAVAEELAAEPRVLCHRDYHSRNLMLHNGLLHVIDFQDARMGPDTYDLASLLRDSYMDLDERLVDNLIDGFLALGGYASAADGGREFRRRFDLMALQRNIKALGTFGFQAASRRNASYLQYVPRTLGYVRATLAAYPRFERLGDLLRAYVPELC